MMIKQFILSALCIVTLSASAEAVKTDANEQLSDAYIRSAVALMSYSQVLETDEPPVMAGILLDAALQLTPDNAQAWAMRAEVAQTAGDQEAYQQALVGYLDTGVDDDRARFDLIRSRLSQSNTLDEQLRQVERLLNSSAGRALSSPLRSRLASFAASVAGELLDEKTRRRWAVDAARADPASLQAAQAMLDLVTELGGDDVRRGTAMVNVVRAGPLAPDSRLQLAALLTDHAAFDRAAQQYEVVSTRLSPQPLHLSAYISWAHCLAMSGQDELLLQLLDEFEAALNQAPPESAEQPAAEGETAQPAAPVEQPPAQPIDLPVGLELIRLAAMDGADESDRAQAVFDRIAKQLRATPQPDGDTEEAEPTEQAKQNLAFIAAVFGPDLDQAEQIAKASDSDPVALGWIALRRGDRAQAQELLGPHANTQPLAACGLALATGQDDAGRARLLQSFIDSSPSSSLAVLAAGRTMIGMQIPAQPTTGGKALLALMAKFPEAFWLVDIDRTPWLDVRMKITPQRVKPLQSLNAEITVWNTSRFPLAITENGPINQNLVVNLSVSNSGRMMPPSSPIVIDLGRRFTLKAGERLIIDTRLDYHQFGFLRATNPGSPFAIDARLVLNPIVTPGGRWIPSGIGGISDVRDCLIESRPVSEDAVTHWMENLSSAVAADRLQALRRLVGLNRDRQPRLINTAMIQRVTPPILDAWDNATQAEQAWMVFNAVALAQDNTTYPAILDRAMKSDSKLVWLALLAGQVSDADSVIIKEAAVGHPPEVSIFADRQRRLLRDYAEYVKEQQAEQPTQPSQ